MTISVTLDVINMNVIFNNNPGVIIMSSSRKPALRSAYMVIEITILPNQRFTIPPNHRLPSPPPPPPRLEIASRRQTSFLGPFRGHVTGLVTNGHCDATREHSVFVEVVAVFVYLSHSFVLFEARVLFVWFDPAACLLVSSYSAVCLTDKKMPIIHLYISYGFHSANDPIKTSISPNQEPD